MEPVKTVFQLDAVDNAVLYQNKPMPYKVKTDLAELEMKCELCLDLPCCPDHCCNVSENPASCLTLSLLVLVGHLPVQRLPRVWQARVDWAQAPGLSVPEGFQPEDVGQRLRGDQRA